MRVIFWDVDGVLNHHGIDGAWARLWRAESLDRTIVARACALVAALNVKCVLSSMWRVDGYDDTLRCLEECGWPSARIDFIGATPHLGGERGGEIEAWLTDHPDVDAFAIVDDAADMASVIDRLIRTDPFSGLSAEDCDRVRALFDCPADERGSS